MEWNKIMAGCWIDESYVGPSLLEGSHPNLFSDNCVIVTILMILITDLFKFEAYVTECKFSIN